MSNYFRGCSTENFWANTAHVITILVLIKGTVVWCFYTLGHGNSFSTINYRTSQLVFYTWALPSSSSNTTDFSVSFLQFPHVCVFQPAVQADVTKIFLILLRLCKWRFNLNFIQMQMLTHLKTHMLIQLTSALPRKE